MVIKMNNTLTTLGLGLVILGSSFAALANEPTLCQAKEYQMALRYQQQSAEIKAIQLQTYRFARQRLAEILQAEQGKTDHKRLAVVMDLDETILDNTPLLVRDMQNCQDYTTWDTWADWEIHGHPTLIPGAKGFIEYADQQGVSLYYVSDRYDENKASTIKTLEELGLPQVSESTVLLYKLSKQQRRDSIAKDHRIIMLMGDSLPDVSAEFKNKQDTQYNRDLVEKNAAHFGQDWIIFPNASYGAWKQAELNAWQSNE